MDLTEILAKANLSLENITEIYYGGDHVCRCGCKGRYAKPGTSLFKRYLTKMAKTPLIKDPEWGINNAWLNLPVDNSTGIGKCYCLYFS